MRFMTNRERADRKERKAIETIEYNKKQVHVSYHKNPGYSEIVASVKSKTNHTIIRKSHPGRKIEKIVIFPKILWANGTYNRKKHGPLKKDTNRRRRNAA